ncbi:MAG: UDP-galactopyranose mutase [Oscillospiraceae bacterium]|nr:UDP-galactopyranose mutase [Oscillospiraceae bacterium]
MKYDYLIVGAGLFGATFASEMMKIGCKCLVVDRREHVAGNAYTENVNGIHVHRYGPHIFHTDKEYVWSFVNQFATFNRFTNSPMAYYQGKMYSLPFNMHTFSQLWDVVSPWEAETIIRSQQQEIQGEPKNLEEQAIALVGRDIYEMLVKGYTEKQWGRECKALPASIIRRLPVRMTYDSNYYDALYQGIPVGGYTKMVENMLDGADVRLGVDYLEDKAGLDAQADRVVYTGPIDAYFGYRFGPLQYRSVRFETEEMEKQNHQGVAVVNYTDRAIPWTRIIEHKWFQFGRDDHEQEIPGTVVSKEYSAEWHPGKEPYYPIRDDANIELLNLYAELAAKEKNVIFGGRLGRYRYLDMDQVIADAMDAAERESAEKGYACFRCPHLEEPAMNPFCLKCETGDRFENPRTTK